MTGDTGDIHAMYTREVHLAECLAVDGGIGDYDALADHGLVLFFPVDVGLRAKEGNQRLAVGFCRYDIENVANVKHRVAVGNAHVVVVQDSRADKVPVHEVVDLKHRLPFEIGVGYLQSEAAGLCGCVLCVFVEEPLFLFLKLDVAQKAYGNGCTDDAQHAQRIGASIA